MDLISPIANAIAYFVIIVAIGIAVQFVIVYIARASTNFFKRG